MGRAGLGQVTSDACTAAQIRRLLRQRAPRGAHDPAAAQRTLWSLRPAPAATGPQPQDGVSVARQTAAPCACADCGKQLVLRCSDVDCLLKGIAGAAGDETAPQHHTPMRRFQVEE